MGRTENSPEAQGHLADALMRPRKPRALAAQRRFRLFTEEFIGQILSAPPDQLDFGIQRGIRGLAQFARAPRSWLAIIGADRTEHPRFREWHRSDLPPLRGVVQEFSEQTAPWLRQQILRLQRLQIRSLADLPAQSTLDREFFEKIGVESTAMVPVTAGGTLLLVGLCALSPRLWDEETMTALALLGSAIANMLERRRSEQRLERLHSTRQTLLQLVPDVFFRLNGDGVICQYEAGRESGYRRLPEDTVGRKLSEILPAQVRPLLESAIDGPPEARGIASFECWLDLDGTPTRFSMSLAPAVPDETIVVLRRLE